MHPDDLFLNGIKNQIIIHREKAISHAGQYFFGRNFTQQRKSNKARQTVFNFVQQGRRGNRVINGNIIYPRSRNRKSDIHYVISTEGRNLINRQRKERFLVALLLEMAQRNNKSLYCVIWDNG